MEKLLTLFNFKPQIGLVYYEPDKYFVTSQHMSKIEAEDNIRVIESLPGIAKLLKSLRTEISWLKAKNEELYQELQATKASS